MDELDIELEKFVEYVEEEGWSFESNIKSSQSSVNILNQCKVFSKYWIRKITEKEFNKNINA
jgi:hypothetical protein